MAVGHGRSNHHNEERREEQPGEGEYRDLIEVLHREARERRASDCDEDSDSELSRLRRRRAAALRVQAEAIHLSADTAGREHGRNGVKTSE